jgi:hypothetical protein
VDWRSVPFRLSTLFVQAFMDCLQLETIMMDEMIASSEDVSAETIDDLFKACPQLKPSFEDPMAWGNSTEQCSRKYFHIFSLYPEVSDKWWKIRVADVTKDGHYDSCWGLFFQ